MPKSPPFWNAGSHAARRPYLMARSRIAAALRGWFAKHNFVEVEAPALQVSPGNETHLHAFATELIGPGGERQRLYLHTSPEFACKKLLAAGETHVVNFARVFRNRERGALHHPEFTMLEWYRAKETYEVLMDDCAALLAETAQAAGAREFRFRDKAIDAYAEPERLTVADAFARYAKIDLLATVSKDKATGTCSQPKRRGSALRRRPTIHGATFSVASCRSALIRGLGLVARHSYMNIRYRWRRWRVRNPAAKRSPSALSSTPAGWNSPMVSVN